MPPDIRDISLRAKVLGAYATPNLNTLLSLLLLLELIFKASKTQAARSNRAGQAKHPTGP
jgi:hypothetical protein